MEVLGRSRDDGWTYAEQHVGERLRLWAYHPRPARLESSELPLAAPSPLILPTGEGLTLDVRAELRRLLSERGELPRPLSGAAARAQGVELRLEPARAPRGGPTLFLGLPGHKPQRTPLEPGQAGARLEPFSISAEPPSVLVLASGPEGRQTLHFAPAPAAPRPLDLEALRRRMAKTEVKVAEALGEQARKRPFREDPSRFFDASKALRRALTLDPNCLEAKLWLATLLALDEDLLEARRWFEDAAAQSPPLAQRWAAREPALQRALSQPRRR